MKKGDWGICIVLWGTMKRSTFDPVCTDKHAWLNLALCGPVCPESSTALWRFRYQTPQTYPSAGLASLGTALHCQAITPPVLALEQPLQVRPTPWWFENKPKLWTDVMCFIQGGEEKGKTNVVWHLKAVLPYLSLLFCVTDCCCKTPIENSLEKTKIPVSETSFQSGQTSKLMWLPGCSSSPMSIVAGCQIQ